MPYDIDIEPVIIKVPSSVALPPGNPTAPEWEDLKGRVTVVEGYGLDDLADVDTDGVTAGQTIVYDPDATPPWIPGTAGGTLRTVRDQSGTFGNDINQLWFRRGLTVETHPDFALMFIQPQYGSSGSQNLVARADHGHATSQDRYFPFPATGTLSGGTRTLVSDMITGLDPTKIYTFTATLVGDLQGEGTGAGYTMPRLTLGIDTRSRFDRVRTVSGVPKEYSAYHPGEPLTDGTSIAVSATISYDEGDPINVGAGALIVRVQSNR